MLDTLVLVPTALERGLLDAEADLSVANEIVIELVGFGPIAAAARAAQLLARYRPRRALLVGLAGGLASDVALGTAYEFDSVAIYGVGAGSGDAHLPASEMGWRQWSESPCISDTIHLGGPPLHRQLLTVCAAAADAHEAETHRRKFPSAVAEDMEGFGVAVACQFADVPLTIVRGISNVAGDRQKENWRIEQAMSAATRRAQQVLAQ